MTNNISASQLQLPPIGLGTWNSPATTLHEAIQYAVQCGYRHIDCAPIYGNQSVIGEALHDLIAKQKAIQRQQLWVTSKLWNSDHKPEDVEKALKKTLFELKLDYLDLFLIHWPIAFKKSVGLSIPTSANDFLSLDEVPLTETWKVMETLVDKGLVAHIGVSNFSISKLKTLLTTARIKPLTNQVECHPFLTQQELLEFCNANNILLTAYSPLGSGGRKKPLLLENKTIVALAQKHQATSAQIVLAWQLTRGVSVIPKSTHPERIKANLHAESLHLGADDIAEINALNINHRYVDGSLFHLSGSPYSMNSIWTE